MESLRLGRTKLVKEIADLPLERIKEASVFLTETIAKKRRIWAAGNGGSAATASHFVSDLVNMVTRRTVHPVDAVCMNDSTTLLTALTNDLGWDEIYSSQLKGLAKEGDSFVALSVNGGGISSEGNVFSRNLLRGIEEANAKGCSTIGIAGSGGGEFAKLCSVVVPISSNDPFIVEPIHSVITHLVLEQVIVELQNS